MKSLARRGLAGVGITALLSALLSAGSCVVAEPYPVSGAVVYEAPPVDRVEVIGVAPTPGFVWVGGWWGWNDRWAWNPGRWERPPRPGAMWNPGRWAPHPQGRGWVWTRGGWR